MKKIITLTLMLLSLNAYCLSPLWIGVGNTTHNMGSAQSNATGSTKKFEFGPTLLVGTTLPFFFSDFYFSPAIGFAKFSTKDGTSKSDIILQYHISQTITPFFLFQYGLSNTITRLGGDGGSLTLNNGTGTATFYEPNKTSTAYVASLDLGGELVFSANYSARLQFSIDHFLSSDRRRVSNLITFNYFL